MNLFIKFFATLAVVYAFNSHASTAIVGTHTLTIKDTTRNREITSEIWFKAKNGSKEKDFSIIFPIRSIKIAAEAQPDEQIKKKPVVLISHGNWGTRYSQGWLAYNLAQNGYMVISVSHPGTMREIRTAEGAYRLWDRSRDVSFVLDKILQDPKWSALIDEKKIGFIGHSFGGWTGVSLAGGIYDPEKQRQFCRGHGIDTYCRDSIQDDISKFDKSDVKNSYRDQRIKAFYIMASGPAQGFSKESLTAIHTPFLVDSSTRDDILDYQQNSKVFAQTIPTAREIPRDVGHFTYVPECKRFIGYLFAKLICTDPEGVDRAKSHQEITASVLAFFHQHLLNMNYGQASNIK